MMNAIHYVTLFASLLASLCNNAHSASLPSPHALSDTLRPLRPRGTVVLSEEETRNALLYKTELDMCQFAHRQKDTLLIQLYGQIATLQDTVTGNARRGLSTSSQLTQQQAATLDYQTKWRAARRVSVWFGAAWAATATTLYLVLRRP